MIVADIDSPVVPGDVASAYTKAMFYAQQIEEDLKQIIFEGEQWGLFPEPLTSEERKRYVDTSAFLDKAMLGKLLLVVEKIGAAKNIRLLNRAKDHRNNLAHHFLAEAYRSKNASGGFCRNTLTKLQNMALDLRSAHSSIRFIRQQVEAYTTLHELTLEKTCENIGVAEFYTKSRYKRQKKMN